MTTGQADHDLLEALDALVLELRHHVERRLPQARSDRIAADQLFVFAGELDAVLRAVSAHLERTRAELERLTRGG